MEELNHQQFGEFSSTRLTGWMTWIYITSGEHLPRPAPRSTTFWRNQSTNQPFGGKNGRMKDKKEIIIPLEHEINLVVPLQWCDLQLLAEKTMRNVGQIPILAKIHCDQITGGLVRTKNGQNPMIPMSCGESIRNLVPHFSEYGQPSLR